MNRYFIPLLIRIIIILGLGFLGVYILSQTYFWLVSIWVFVACIVAIWELSRYLTRSRREYAEFLIAMSQGDFSTRSHVKQPDDLQKAYETVREGFSNLRKEITASSHFLEALVEHAGVALLGYEVESGKITIMNAAAKRLFASSRFHHMSSFTNAYPLVGEKIESLSSGMDTLVKLIIDGRVHQLSLNVKEMVLSGKPYKLISIQDIQAALENKELESWQKLIRVLTHEIKNSAIPISTLSDVIHQLIIDEGKIRSPESLDPDEVQDVKNGLETIGRRSRALVDFVSAYGKLARIPEPRPDDLNALQLIRTTVRLMEDTFRSGRISVGIDCDESMQIWADRALIEQVLINLVKNAAEALEKTASPEICIRCFAENNRTIIEIADNGPGMDEDLMEQIFIPFFSTKKKGSGIGLSLSQQIMRAHRGQLLAISKPGHGTQFRLVF